MSATPAGTVSKREQKRQAKLAKELAANSSVNQDPIQTETSPSLSQDNTEPQTAVYEPKPSPFIEPVQKRIRNYLKKKQKIDHLEERANDPLEKEKLNKDQLEQLSRKDQVLAPLKELQNLAEQFSELQIEHHASLKVDATESKQSSDAAVKAAREEGIEEGRKVLSSLISFLGYASVLRANPTDDKDYNDANERLLSIVYLGGVASLKAAHNIHAGSTDTIDDTTITFRQVHDAIQQPSSTDAADTVAETPADSGGEDVIEGDDQHYVGTNFVSLSDLRTKPSTIGSGGISFLNESEIEGTHLNEGTGFVADAESSAAPGQTIAAHDGNNAAEALDWSGVNATRTNWADEDVSESVKVVDVIEALSDPVDVPQKSALQPLSDFQTIEKKTAHKDTTKGRGRGRGRGDRGSRGRGELRGSKPRVQ